MPNNMTKLFAVLLIIGGCANTPQSVLMGPAPAFDEPMIEKWYWNGKYRRFLQEGEKVFDVSLAVVNQLTSEVDKRLPGKIDYSHYGLAAFRQNNDTYIYVFYPLYDHECLVLDEVDCPSPGTPAIALEYRPIELDFVTLTVDSSGLVVNCIISSDVFREEC